MGYNFRQFVVVARQRTMVYNNRGRRSTTPDSAGYNCASSGKPYCGDNRKPPRSPLYLGYNDANSAPVSARSVRQVSVTVMLDQERQTNTVSSHRSHFIQSAPTASSNSQVPTTLLARQRGEAADGAALKATGKVSPRGVTRAPLHYQRTNPQC